MPVLQFKGKSVIETYHHVVAHHRLEFDARLSLLPKGEKPRLDGNLIIEGDNLLALKALLPTHAGKVKCVYIDPPYNTGNEGWVYNDNLTQPQFKEWIGQTVGKEGEDACRHDKWCCMMYPRLQLLKELLREDGSIWVSIDDNEVSSLRFLLDEIFGADCFVGTAIWQKKYAISSDAKGLPPLHDYIMVYGKKPGFQPGMLKRSEKQDQHYKNPDNDPRGPWRADNLLRREFRERDAYAIRSPKTGKEFFPPPGTSWRHPKPVIDQMIEDNRIWFGQDGNGRPVPKRFLAEVRRGVVASGWWTYDEVGHNDESAKEIQRIFGGETVFPFPKPTRLIRRIVQLASAGDDIILDSTAGSGTTGHAVLLENLEDGHQRHFVLVQQRFDSKSDEDAQLNICRDVTRERVLRIVNGFKSNRRDETKARTVKGLGGSFTYVRVGERLFGEYRDLGEKLPDFEQLARYVFYTETSRECDPGKFKQETGFIGSTDPSGGTSYYLLYTPNHKQDREMSLETLKSLLKHDKNRNWVIYCEKIWLHQDQLRKFELEHGRRIRPMLIPFNLK